MNIFKYRVKINLILNFIFEAWITKIEWIYPKLTWI